MLPGIGSLMAGTGGPDPFITSVRMLLHFNGANNSTTFTDSSQYAYAVTRAGSAKISTTQSKFGGSAGYFDGTGDYIYSDDTYPAWGTSSLTVECFFRYTNDGTTQYVFDTRLNSGDLEPYVEVNNTTLSFGLQNTTAATTTVAGDTWYHVAVTRDTDTWRFFLNGTKIGSNFTMTSSLARRALTIGTSKFNRDTGGTRHLTGYVDDFRLSVGVARYTSNFTVTTTQFPDP